MGNKGHLIKQKQRLCVEAKENTYSVLHVIRQYSATFQKAGLKYV